MKRKADEILMANCFQRAGFKKLFSGFLGKIFLIIGRAFLSITSKYQYGPRNHDLNDITVFEAEGYRGFENSISFLNVVPRRSEDTDFTCKGGCNKYNLQVHKWANIQIHNHKKHLLKELIH